MRLERVGHYHDAKAFPKNLTCGSPINGRSCFETPLQICDHEQILLRLDRLTAGVSPQNYIIYHESNARIKLF